MKKFEGNLPPREKDLPWWKQAASMKSEDYKMREANNHGGKRHGAGRKPSPDPRIPLPFRMRTSIIAKAKRLGRDRLEAMIKRAKETPS